MKILDLTIIADRWCPTSRTYLTYLHHAGFQVQKIILVDFLGPNKKLRMLRRFFGAKIAGKIMTRRRPAWPYQDHDGLFTALQAGMENQIDYGQPFHYAVYAKHVQEIVAEDYDDVYFQNYLKKESCQTFLYTNGGRVPVELLSHPGVRIFHVHPGIVPHVRGSDGLLWSILTRGKAGVSCFYMDSGIDTGKIIKCKEFALPSFPVKAPANSAQEEALYKALLIAYDPHLRANLLRDIIVEAEGKALNNLTSLAQPAEKIASYLWMHPLMRMKILSLVTQ